MRGRGLPRLAQAQEFIGFLRNGDSESARAKVRDPYGDHPVSSDKKRQPPPGGAKPKSEKIPETKPPNMPRADGTKISSAINVSVIMAIPRGDFHSKIQVMSSTRSTEAYQGPSVSRSQSDSGN
jgi:hypothetical protein